MIVKVLVENTSAKEAFGAEHGLSLYLETAERKLLFDVGVSALFLDNARIMGVDIGAVDDLIISHGHYDHGGGLASFFEVNKKAPVFLHEDAFGRHFSDYGDAEPAYVGLDQALKSNDRICLTNSHTVLYPGIELFTTDSHPEPMPSSNRGLLKETGGIKRPDSFSHEQNLIIIENGRSFLFTGCAHNGIVNIILQFETLKGVMPDFVIGGFHLGGHRNDGAVDREELDKIADFFIRTKANYLTGHCTGEAVFAQLKTRLGEKIAQLSAGCIFSL